MALPLTQSGFCGKDKGNGWVPLPLRALLCPNCGKIIAQEQIERGTVKLRCRHCKTFVVVTRDNQAGGT